MTPIEGSDLCRFQPTMYEVEKAISLLKDLRKLWVHEDLQILLLEDKPEQRVQPLELSSEIDPTLPLKVYGCGRFCAENASKRMHVMPGESLAKINTPTYQIDPMTSILTRCQIAISGFLQKLNPTISLRCVASEIKRQEGIIEAITFFDQGSLQTHIGGGFSGPPAMQDSKIIGAVHSGRLEVEGKLSDTKHDLISSCMEECGLLTLQDISFPGFKNFLPGYMTP